MIGRIPELMTWGTSLNVSLCKKGFLLFDTEEAYTKNFKKFSLIRIEMFGRGPNTFSPKLFLKTNEDQNKINKSIYNCFYLKMKIKLVNKERNYIKINKKPVSTKLF